MRKTLKTQVSTIHGTRCTVHAPGSAVRGRVIIRHHCDLRAAAGDAALRGDAARESRREMRSMPFRSPLRIAPKGRDSREERRALAGGD